MVAYPLTHEYVSFKSQALSCLFSHTQYFYYRFHPSTDPHSIFIELYIKCDVQPDEGRVQKLHTIHSTAGLRCSFSAANEIAGSGADSTSQSIILQETRLSVYHIAILFTVFNLQMALSSLKSFLMTVLPIIPVAFHITDPRVTNCVAIKT